VIVISLMLAARLVVADVSNSTYAPLTPAVLTTASLDQSSTSPADATDATDNMAASAPTSAPAALSEFKDVTGAAMDREGEFMSTGVLDDKEDDESNDGVALAIAGFFAAFFGVFGLLSAIFVTFLWRHLSREHLIAKRNAPVQKKTEQLRAERQNAAQEEVRAPAVDPTEGAAADFKPIVPVLPLGQDETPHVPACKTTRSEWPTCGGSSSGSHSASHSGTHSSTSGSSCSSSSSSSSSSSCASSSHSSSNRNTGRSSILDDNAFGKLDSQQSFSETSPTSSALEQEGSQGVTEIVFDVEDVKITVDI